MTSELQTPYEILGEAGIRALANAFYDAMQELPEAAEILAMHEEDLDPMRRMLGTYLIGWMGGPPVYLATKGTVCLNEVHAHLNLDSRHRDLWLLCMSEALVRVEASETLIKMLEKPFFHIADTIYRTTAEDHALSDRANDPNIIAVSR